MFVIPDHIEKYLCESGFSATEVLILKHLQGNEAWTLRELAAKVGKSTGVLDQASKRLMQKSIVQKRMVNGVPRYLIDSYDAVLSWTKRSLQHQWDHAKRRIEDLESFFVAMQCDISRPTMQYFEGEEGLEKAYAMLLNTQKDWCHYFPCANGPLSDSLKAVHTEVLRQRRKRGMFARVIAHDYPEGRQYASRDHLELRKTVLVSKTDMPDAYEKIIAGDVIACFNQSEHKAYLLISAELAHTELVNFDIMWELLTHAHTPKGCTAAPAQQKNVPDEAHSNRFIASCKQAALALGSKTMKIRSVLL